MDQRPYCDPPPGSHLAPVMEAHPAPVVIAGGGLAGCLAAFALAMRRPDVPLLLLEQETRFGGNHIWSFFDTGLG